MSAFWDNLRRGEESIVTLSEEDLLAAGISEKALANHAYVRRAALMNGIDEFDADFFGFTPQAARIDGSATPAVPADVRGMRSKTPATTRRTSTVRSACMQPARPAGTYCTT